MFSREYPAENVWVLGAQVQGSRAHGMLCMRACEVPGEFIKRTSRMVDVYLRKDIKRGKKELKMPHLL